MKNRLTELSNYFGLNVSGERLSNPELLLAKKLAVDTNSSQPISDLLQYESYDDENNLFFNSDGSGGFCFEINPKVGYDPHIEKNLKLFFNDELPKNAFLKFLMLA